MTMISVAATSELKWETVGIIIVSKPHKASVTDNELVF